ncbi:MAG: glycosyltransferase family 39 protein [Sphaerospermopsis sp. SIO1G1]|nr:glycosyltransferase family 39 protein [Sphaerospermopsis sp. SIO1G1]
MPINQVFQFDTDEGIAVSLANLYSKQIISDPTQTWSDHPPLFPLIISTFLDIFGYGISAARILTLLFATLLIWCFSQILRLSVSRKTTIITILLLIFSVNFLRLSVSVMQAIPCLSLGMLSIYLIILYTINLRIYLLILSAVILALSLHIKMIMIFLLPVTIIYLFTSFHSLQSILKLSTIQNFSFIKSPICIWLLSLTTAFITISFLTNSFDFKQTFLFHLSSNLKDNFQDHNSFLDVIYIYLQNFDVLLLSFLPLQYLKNSHQDINHQVENRIYQIPLSWLIIITFVFLKHKPIWYHYIVLVSVPLVWLSAYGIQTIFNQIKFGKLKKLSSTQLSKFAILTILFALLVIPIKLGVITWENHKFIVNSQVKFTNLERVITYKDQSHWLFTDVGMYGFYSQINVPPEISVISRKRLGTETLNSEFLIQVLSKYQPEQILINRFPHLADLIKPYLQSNYQEIYTDKSTKHYLRNDIYRKS